MARSGLQRELLRLLQPRIPQRERLVSEQIAPQLSEVARRLSGRPAEEVHAALAAVVTRAGATPDERALAEFAAQVEAGEDPFAD